MSAGISPKLPGGRQNPRLSQPQAVLIFLRMDGTRLWGSPADGTVDGRTPYPAKSIIVGTVICLAFEVTTIRLNRKAIDLRHKTSTWRPTALQTTV